MKNILLVASLLCSCLVNAQINTITPGTSAPAFSLPNVNGKNISFASFPEAKGYIVVFTCNTCPVSKAYEERIISLHKKYAPLGYPVIAINPNDPEVVAGDSFDAMKERAKSKEYPFPYLFDKGQAVTNAYGARVTPHVFLVQKKNDQPTVMYTGAIDNDPENGADKTAYLEQAIRELSSGTALTMTSTKAIGCSVKRKKSDL